MLDDAYLHYRLRHSSPTLSLTTIVDETLRGERSNTGAFLLLYPLPIHTVAVFIPTDGANLFQAPRCPVSMT
jgi:hypothetical protein